MSPHPFNDLNVDVATDEHGPLYSYAEIEICCVACEEESRQPHVSAKRWGAVEMLVCAECGEELAAWGRRA